MAKLRRQLVWLGLIALTSGSCYAGTASLSWIPPTQNADGSALAGPLTYRASWGCGSPGSYPNSTAPISGTSHQLTGLPDVGTCYFVATATDALGRTSGFSNEASKLMGVLNAPGEPSVSITWAESPFEPMAARVGTGVSGASDGSASTIASAAKATTSGNLLVAFVKWEGSTATATSLADTAGNTWVEIVEGFYNVSATEPRGALYYAANITGHATNVVTATLSGASTYRRIIVEEFSGLETSSPLDEAAQTGLNVGTTYTTANITTTTTGLVFMGVAGYTSLSGHSGTPGTPDFTIGAANADTFVAYLISGSAQTVTPGASAAESNAWWAASQAFKDAAGGGTVPRANLMLLGAGW